MEMATPDISTSNYDEVREQAANLAGGSGSLDRILLLDPIDPFLLVIDFTFDFCLVQSIYDGILPFGNMYYSAINYRDFLR